WRLAISSCDSIGQAEGREGLGSKERGDLLDQRASQREEDEVVQCEDARFLVPGVAAEGELRVRARGYEAPALFVGERQPPQETGNRFAAPIPAWQRGHRHPRVFSQHRDQRVDVVAFPGGDEALDYFV